MNDTSKMPSDADEGRASDAASGMSGGSNAGGLHGNDAGKDPNKPTAQSEKAATEQDDGAVPSEGY